MITAELFIDARRAFGTREAAAEACGLSLRQIRRYESGATAVPLSIYRLLRLLAGDLGQIDPQWEGWRLHRATLYPPWHQEFGLAWFMWLREHTRRREAREFELEQEMGRLRAKHAALERALAEGRPEPEQIDLFCTPPAPRQLPPNVRALPVPGRLDRRSGDRRRVAATG